MSRSSRCRASSAPPSHPAGPPVAGSDAAGVPEAHPLALPPPWETYPAPLVIKRVVQAPAPQAGGPRRVPTVRRNDALQLTDANAGPAGPSWADLIDLADHRVVIVSLAVLASAINRVSARAATLCVRRQQDKPTCAMVREASFITRGFALNDVFWYGWHDPSRNAYVQRYLGRSPRLREFCEANDMIPVLITETDTDAGSGHPLCLYHARRSGFLLAIDTEPPSGWASARPVSPYANRLLRQALGQTRPLRGQYVVPPRCRQEFEQTMYGLGDRFPRMRWVPTHGIHRKPPIGLIELNLRPGGTARIQQPHRIGIRTGFAADEWDLVFGVAMFLKQLAASRGSAARSDNRQRGRRHAAPAEHLTPAAIEWIPLAGQRAVPPPAGPKEYTYVIAVPPELRRTDTTPGPSRPDVRIDLKRARDGEITIRLPAKAAPAVRTIATRLAGLSGPLGVPIRVDASARLSGSVETWELTFPVEPNPHAYDAITAADRVACVLDAVLYAAQSGSTRPRHAGRTGR
jgi:hypothetical protein